MVGGGERSHVHRTIRSLLLRQFRDSGSPAAVNVLTGDASAATATTCLKAGLLHAIAFHHGDAIQSESYRANRR